MTVRELILQPDLSDISCRTAENFLDTEVSGCSVLEFSESVRWVKKRELVLTTGRIFEHDEDLQRKLIVELKECGCAALGVKIKSYLRDIPQAMIEEAKKQQFPLLDIPFYYSFSQIGEAVYYHSFRQTLTGAQKGELLLEGLGKIFFAHQGLEAMVGKISIDTGYTFLVTDSQYNIIALHASEEYREIFSQGTDTRLEPVWNSDFFAGKEEKGKEFFRYSNFKIKGVPYRFLVQALPDGVGCLCVPVEQGELEPYIREVIRKSSTIIALEMTRAEKVRQGGSHDFFLDFLREDSNKGESEIVNLCGIYAFPYQYKRVCLVFRVEKMESKFARDKMKEAFQKIVDRECGTNIRSYLCTGIGILASFLMFKDEVSDIQAEEIAYRAAALFVEERRTEHIEITAGISRCHRKVMSIKAAFAESMEALNLKQRMGSMDSVFRYQEAWIYHILYRLPKEELKELCRDRIGIVADYDERCKTRLTETIKVYYDSHFNMTEAAEKLFIHRNTMRQRMEKISELLHVEPDLSDCGYSLYLGICAWELLKNMQDGEMKNERRTE